MNNMAGILKANMNAPYQSWHDNLDTAAAVYFLVCVCIFYFMLIDIIKTHLKNKQ